MQYSEGSCRYRVCVPQTEHAARGRRCGYVTSGQVMPDQISERRLQTFKNGLTLQLFLQRGPFWDAVRELRQRWQIDASPRIPMNASGKYFQLPGAQFQKPTKPDSELADPRLKPWLADLRALHNRVIPLEYEPTRTKHSSFVFWLPFLNQCVLFDPPPLMLRAFASAPTSMGIEHSVGSRSLFDRSTYSAMATNSPMVKWTDPEEILATERAFWRQVLHELAQRYLEPHGVELESALQEIWRETSLVQQHNETLNQLPRYNLIMVSTETTQDEVIRSFQTIAATRSSHSKGGRPAIDDLTAVECANRKQAGWTNRQISEHYGFPLRSDSYDRRRRSNVAAAHIKRGEAILNGREYSSE